MRPGRNRVVVITGATGGIGRASARAFAALDTAAGRIEAELGPIDVWVNDAFTSVFAPFGEIGADEFRRVTEVTTSAS